MSDTTTIPSIDPVQQRAFEDWLDTTYGIIEILDGAYLPSEILPRVDPDVYRAELIAFTAAGPPPTRADSTTPAASAPPSPNADEELKRTVRDHFPLPVAHCLYRFEHGALTPHQQLLFLRDIWESVIFLLYALVVSEFQAARGSVVGTRISRDRLLSDKVNDKLTIMRQLHTLGEEQNLNLVCTSLVSAATLNQLTELNRVRNDFSHNSTMSERQVRDIIDRYTDTVLDLLRGVTAMQDVRLLRYVGSTGSHHRIQHQSFTGHNISRAFGVLELPRNRMTEFFHYLDDSKVLAYMGGRLFSLAPFVHFVEDDTGQWTRLCFFKQHEAATADIPGKLVFEVLGDATRIDTDEALFLTELNQLAVLAPPVPPRRASTS